MRRSACLLSLLVLSTVTGLFAPSALAYEQTGDAVTPTTRSIEGRVLTSSGSPVKGAVVLIKDSKTLQVRSYLAQADGQYHFYGLSADVNYSLRAEDQDMTSKTKTVSVFDSHRQVKLDLKLTKKRAKK